MIKLTQTSLPTGPFRWEPMRFRRYRYVSLVGDPAGRVYPPGVPPLSWRHHRVPSGVSSRAMPRVARTARIASASANRRLVRSCRRRSTAAAISRSSRAPWSMRKVSNSSLRSGSPGQFWSY